MERKYRVKLNSIDKIEELLQEVYEQACRNINEIQVEINKLSNSTNLGDETVSIEDKTKYGKMMNDFSNTKLKANGMKLDIARFMGEIIKHNGNIDETLNDQGFAKRTSLDLASLRAEMNKSDNSVETFELKK